MRNVILSRGTAADIENQVNKVLRGLGNPEPPLRLEDVRELLKLDRRYYSTTDDGYLRETISKLTVAGAQIMKRPGLLLEAVRKLIGARVMRPKQPARFSIMHLAPWMCPAFTLLPHWRTSVLKL